MSPEAAFWGATRPGGRTSGGAVFGIPRLFATTSAVGAFSGCVTGVFGEASVAAGATRPATVVLGRPTPASGAGCTQATGASGASS